MSRQQYITVDPAILVGKPIIRGTRLSVELILDRLADGWTAEDLYAAYPALRPETLRAVLAMAAELVREEHFVISAKLGE